MAVEEFIQIITEQLKNIAYTEAHVGKPIEVGTTTVIPISKISIGFGAGGANEGNEGRRVGGGGGGFSVEPVAFLVVRQDGSVELCHLNAPGSPASKLVELLPDVIEQIIAYIQRQKDE